MLSKSDQLIYRKSDKIELVPIKNAEALRTEVNTLERALKGQDRKAVQSLANQLLNTLAKNIGTPLLNIRELSCRPANDIEELHGLHEPSENGKKARISVWIKTESRKKVVAFRSFLRTLLDDLCHHIDYELFGFEESFHTEVFFKRESHIFKQLLGEERSGLSKSAW